MLGGDQLGAYCLSEPASGSDAAALRTSAAADGDEYVIDGVKAWISHGGQADFYALFARTSGDRPGPDRARGISCFHVPAHAAGRVRRAARAQDGHARLGHRADAVRRRPGARRRTWSASPARASRSPCPRWTPAGSASPPAPPGWPRPRWTRRSATPGSAASSAGRSSSSRALGFMLADMATAVEAARALYLDAARRKDAGLDFGQQAAMAKLFASDTAMRVTTDAVQVLGGVRLRRGLPGRAVHARGQGAADRRGHQPDPAHGHQPRPVIRPASSPAIRRARRPSGPVTGTTRRSARTRSAAARTARAARSGSR